MRSRLRRLFAMLEWTGMARHPDWEKPEKLTQKDLDELRYNLAHLSVDAVRRFYERAHQDCRMIYDRQLWKWR